MTHVKILGAEYEQKKSIEFVNFLTDVGEIKECEVMVCHNPKDAKEIILIQKIIPLMQP